MIGTSVGENWLIFPEGMECVYLFCPSKTGGSSYLLIIIDFIVK